MKYIGYYSERENVNALDISNTTRFGSSYGPFKQRYLMPVLFTANLDMQQKSYDHKK